MGLNPGESKVTERIRSEELNKSFNGGSPYFDMYRCGLYAVPLDDCVSKCKSNGIALRPKDIEAWEDGKFKHDMQMIGQSAEKIQRVVVTETGVPFDDAKLEDFPMLPQGWTGTTRRFFPCTQDNRPMQKWGWSRDFVPELLSQADAKTLSPVGWVGQNMLYQRFIVIDIDGRGHGQDDEDTIAFGRMFENATMKMEDPAKPGSFHLYFSTDRLIPVRHFPWAKIDLMGNAVNAAVYVKNKVSNGVNMAPIDNEVWSMLMAYQKARKESLCL